MRLYQEDGVTGDKSWTPTEDYQKIREGRYYEHQTDESIPAWFGKALYNFVIGNTVDFVCNKLFIDYFRYSTSIEEDSKTHKAADKTTVAAADAGIGGPSSSPTFKKTNVEDDTEDNTEAIKEFLLDEAKSGALQNGDSIIYHPNKYTVQITEAGNRPPQDPYAFTVRNKVYTFTRKDAAEPTKIDNPTSNLSKDISYTTTTSTTSVKSATAKKETVVPVIIFKLDNYGSLRNVEGKMPEYKSLVNQTVQINGDFYKVTGFETKPREGWGSAVQKGKGEESFRWTESRQIEITEEGYNQTTFTLEKREDVKPQTHDLTKTIRLGNTSSENFEYVTTDAFVDNNILDSELRQLDAKTLQKVVDTSPFIVTGVLKKLLEIEGLDIDSLNISSDKKEPLKAIFQRNKEHIELEKKLIKLKQGDIIEVLEWGVDPVHYEIVETSVPESQTLTGNIPERHYFKVDRASLQLYLVTGRTEKTHTLKEVVC